MLMCQAMSRKPLWPRTASKVMRRQGEGSLAALPERRPASRARVIVISIARNATERGLHAYQDIREVAHELPVALGYTEAPIVEEQAPAPAAPSTIALEVWEEYMHHELPPSPLKPMP